MNLYLIFFAVLISISTAMGMWFSVIGLLVWIGELSTFFASMAQRTNAFTYGVVGRTGAARRLGVRISRQPWKRFLKKCEFPNVKNLINTLPGPPEIGTARWWHVDPYIRSGPEYPTVPGGESVYSVVRLSLGRRLVNFLPVGRRANNALTLCSAPTTKKRFNFEIGATKKLQFCWNWRKKKGPILLKLANKKRFNFVEIGERAVVKMGDSLAAPYRTENNTCM